MSEPKIDLSKIREKIKGLQGRNFWRSLEELAETDDFKSYVKEEFPHGAAAVEDPESRRNFLKIMGASLALAALPGCGRQPTEKIIPYAKAPENRIPGKPLLFATAMHWNGHATGLLVESHEGRPTKIDGNPQHPDSLGATNSIQQAAILGLYDPDRSKNVMGHGHISSWRTFAAEMKGKLKEAETNGGKGIRILTGKVTSPTLSKQLNEFFEKYPKAKRHQYEAVARDAARQAQKIAFTEYADSVYNFRNAQVILSLGANFLADAPGSLRYARHFMKNRKVDLKQKEMNRLYTLESSPSITGASSDHLLSRKTSTIEAMALALANELGLSFGTAETPLNAEEKKWVHAVAEDLKKNHGKSLVIAGEQMPVLVQVIAHALNEKLANVGQTVDYIQAIEENPVEEISSLRELVSSMNRGEVDLLLMLGGNPVFDAPGDLQFLEALKKVETRVHLSLYEDETSAHCHWQIPQAHFLETFSDGKASDGTVTVAQPLIKPLYRGKSEIDIMNTLLGREGLSQLETLKSYWKEKLPTIDFEKSWRKATHDGLIAGTQFSTKKITAKTSIPAAELNRLQTKAAPQYEYEVTFRPDPSIWDGQFANNGWLQELPKPFTKMTWDNPALISAQTASELNLANGDFVNISYGEQKIKVPVWILPGHADGSVSLFYGYGRTLAGNVGNKTGFDISPLRNSKDVNLLTGVKVAKAGGNYKLATTQNHQVMEGRDLVRSGTLDEFKKKPNFAQHAQHGDPSKPVAFYTGHESEDYAWAMSINLSACIGCNACVTACQSENNVPIVGKDEVLVGREMHWVRIDTYYEGKMDHPYVYNQPVMCMHCENAPCEPVCPVGATTHSPEGLNEMTYNRCVGTRYCANNCPYKVRRFNFFEYADKKSKSLSLMRNPDVTVRNRGVMEKCTFCVQKINEARIDAKKENRKIRDGEIKTACQTSCPTEAIVFGNMKDAKSAVSKEKNSPLNYGILTELNTQPRLTYLAKVRNPNPSLEPHALNLSGAHH